VTRLLPALLALALPALVAGGALAGEEPALPAGTVPRADFPPYGPDPALGREEVAAWCARTAAAAAQGGPRAADLLASAAEALAGDLGRRAEAARLYARALDAYPPEDPGAGLVLLRWARQESWRGNTPQVGRLLGRLRPWAGRLAPRDLDAAAARRWRLLREALAWELPGLRATWLERQGHFAEAAASLEELAAADVPRRGAATQAHLRERAARLRYRAGQRARALEDVDAAIALRRDDDTALARLRFWRLQASHGLLTEGAAALATARWPDEGYERDVLAYLASVHGVEGCATRYLALGSNAYAAGHLRSALAIYRMALRDPVVVEAARHHELVWRGLLLGFDAALELGRFDEAERLLEAVGRVADEPIPERDRFLVAIRRARARAHAGEAPAPPPGAGPAPHEPRGPPLGLETGAERRARPAAPPAPPGRGADGGGGAPLPLLAGLALAALLALVGLLALPALRRRRHRRR
jgi:tetratricopeptide (TPR) repeat protein